MLKGRRKLISPILFAFTANLAALFFCQDLPAQDDKRKLNKVSSSKIWASLEGFRSAKFGMNEDEILESIRIDFHISKEEVVRKIHPAEKTLRLAVRTPNLLPDSGPAQVVYLLGFRSKQLIEVDIFWGSPLFPDVSSADVLNTAHMLRSHFDKQRFQKDKLVVNGVFPDGSILVFRGKDKMGRMVILHYKEAIQKKSDPTKLTPALRLSYIEKPDSADVFKLKEGEF